MSNEREQLIARLRRLGTVLGASGGAYATYDTETCELAIAALSAPPAGYVLVPREPTTEMCYAMAECDGYHRTDRDCPGPARWEDYWRMAIAAAPPAQAQACRADGRCQYAIDHGTEGLAACDPQCVMPAPTGSPDARRAVVTPKPKKDAA